MAATTSFQAMRSESPNSSQSVPEPMDTTSDDHAEQNAVASAANTAAGTNSISTEKKRFWWNRRSKSDGNLVGMGSSGSNNTNNVPQQTLLVPNVRGKKRSFRNPQDSIKVAYRKGKKKKNKETADPSKGWLKLSLR
mmetsp:Transcript_14589/g.20618  ORF Transcript_14589/g.20618 Transcript_14589/m.20618 type:complete len:137 (-) Transcript_14589:273-683(-)